MVNRKGQCMNIIWIIIMRYIGYLIPTRDNESISTVSVFQAQVIQKVSRDFEVFLIQVERSRVSPDTAGIQAVVGTGPVLQD